MTSIEKDRSIFDGCGLYVHVAYCRSKCIYCDFFSAGERIADWPRYVDALCSEFSHRKDELAWPLRTLYIGGGTPSLMPEKEFSRLCGFLRPYMNDVEEFTIEVNPDDVDEHKLDMWKREGVNRISLGIQTFCDASLMAIGRRHDCATSLRAYELASKVFGNVSVDLMFGLPGQTMDIWMHDLETVLRMRPQHISAYSLMYEEGTALTVLRDSGRIEETDDETTERMFSILIERLSAAGYDHYEISNFALPGFRSRHNSSYWLQYPYIGIGPSAHSYDGLALRKASRSDLRGYLKHWAPLDVEGLLEERVVVEEVLSDVELMEEYVLTRLRMREGIPLADFRLRFGTETLGKLLRKCGPLVAEGLLELSETHVCLTEKAILVSDAVILDLSDL